MPTDQAEASRLIAASGLNQTTLAEELTRRLGRPIKHYMLSRIVAGGRKRVEADVMDALRAIVAGEPANSPGGSTAQTTFRHPVRLTDTALVVPLFGGAAGQPGVRLGEEYMVGVVPLHPAQMHAAEPFAFVAPDARLSPRINRGEIVYVLRGRPPSYPSQLCLVEKTGGEAQAWFFEGEDANTLTVSQSNPKRTEHIPLRDVAAVYLIVGITFAGG